MVLEKVIDIIAEELSVDPSEITEDSNLVEDLDADSLAVSYTHLTLPTT